MVARTTDVAVVDLNLPDADGRDVAKALESHGVRTVIWTGAPSEDGDVNKNGGIAALSDRLVDEFDKFGRTAHTDPEIPAILLVENNDCDAGEFRTVLAETGVPCSLTRASSAEEALKLLQDGSRFQALVVGEHLPGMRGGVFLRLVRSRPEFGDPIIYRLSADPTVTGKVIHKPPSCHEVTIAVVAARMVGMLTILAAVHVE